VNDQLQELGDFGLKLLLGHNVLNYCRKRERDEDGPSWLCDKQDKCNGNFPVSTPSAHVSARRQAGGQLEQIQFLLRHGLVQTPERYLGCKQRLHDAVNEDIGWSRRYRHQHHCSRATDHWNFTMHRECHMRDDLSVFDFAGKLPLNNIVKQSGDEDGSQVISAERRRNSRRSIAAQCGHWG
jgi:hypothetical protein